MTTFKTIVATAVIAAGGTVAAFTGLHPGQSPAEAATAAQPAKTRATYAVPVTVKDIAKPAVVVTGQPARTHAARHHQRRQERQVHHGRQAASKLSTRTAHAVAGSSDHRYDHSYDHAYNSYDHGSCGGSCDGTRSGSCGPSRGLD
jgi:hypothetical protein